jgi:hypothetical protein
MIHRYVVIAIGMVMILAVGVWFGSGLSRSPQLVPTAAAQGIVVEQDHPDRAVAAVFTVSQSGRTLYWWRVQNNGIGHVTIFDSGTGSVTEKEFRRR